MKNLLSCLLAIILFNNLCAQDTIHSLPPDTSLRILNLNPFFTVHVDSSFSYLMQVNRADDRYFWYLRNAPVGLRINKETGLISFRPDKKYFLSGKLKYDQEYRVAVGVQNMAYPDERVDTSFVLVFFNTEVIPSRVKPSVHGTIWIEEGETASFRVLCETGNYPFESIMTLTSVPVGMYQSVQQCGDAFSWTPSYDFVKESDPERSRIAEFSFIGSDRFRVRDTATVRIIVKESLNYPFAVAEYNQAAKNLDLYVLQLKYTFLQLDKRLKKTKNVRTTFDLTSATTSLTGTILSTSSSDDAQKTGKILPSVGLALVPIKEASVPSKVVDQNQAALIRSSIKRLEYMRHDNVLIGQRDPDILKKTAKLKDELKQVQIQLIEIPVDFTSELSEEELNRYFNSPRVNKKYRLGGK